MYLKISFLVAIIKAIIAIRNEKFVNKPSHGLIKIKEIGSRK